MILYHETRGCSLAVDIVARELGVNLRIEWVNMKSKRLHDGSDYFEVNSKGTVPTLQLSDGARLTEGAIIMQWLADQYPESELLPTEGIARDRVLEWMSFIGADLHKGGFMPLFKATTPAAYRSIARQYLGQRLAWLNAQLADRNYLTGSTFTIADAHCYTIAMWTRAHAINTADWPNLERYLALVGNRPSVVAAELAARQEAERQSTVNN